MTPPGGSRDATREDILEKTRTLRSSSRDETIRIGKRIGRHLKAGDVVALTGELGAGKTHLIKGIAAGAGIRETDRVTSPSFTLLQEYPGKIPFYHVDFFRLNLEEESETLGLEDVLGKNGITAIEWAGKFPSWLPEDHLSIHIDYLGPHARSLSFQGRGKGGERLLREIFPDPDDPEQGSPESRCLRENPSSP